MGTRDEVADKPGAVVSWLACAVAVMLWGAVHLFVFRDDVMPLSYVLPLLICVWTRRIPQLWVMAGLFAIMVLLKALWITPGDLRLTFDRFGVNDVSRLINIGVAGVVIHSIVVLRIWLEARNAELTATNQRLSEANAEIAAQNETLQANNGELDAINQELATREELVHHQNDELQSQSEALTRQNEELKVQTEELESQSEELQNQSEELQQLNEELAHRQTMLQTLLEAACGVKSEKDVMTSICAAALQMLGREGLAAAVTEQHGEELLVQAYAGFENQSLAQQSWAFDHSMAAMVMKQDRPAFLEDVLLRPDIIIPQPVEGPGFRSLLVTPLRIDGTPMGTIEFYSPYPQKWTREQFRLAEWVASQCALILCSLRLRSQLRHAKETAEAATRAKDQFLAVLSHELRTPLNPALMAATILESDPDMPAKFREDVAMIRRNVELEARLIDDMLDITRIARGKLTLSRRLIDAQEIVRHAVQTCQAEAIEKGVDLQVDMDAERAKLYADPARLQQIVWNLLKNAIKFTPAGGKVSIRAHNDGEARSEEERLVIEISDTGMGIEPELLPRLFTAFEQGGDETTRRFGGLGMGLAICKGLVEMHGGSICAYSHGLNTGATFKVSLGVAPHEPSAQGTQPGLDAKQLCETLRILLVEDHETTALITARLLRGFGHDVQTAGSIDAAVGEFSGKQFDLVISDLGLPDGDGCELLRRITATRPVKAIALSGYGMDSDINKTRAAGFLEHLTKPINVQQLQAAINRVSGA